MKRAIAFVAVAVVSPVPALVGEHTTAAPAALSAARNPGQGRGPGARTRTKENTSIACLSRFWPSAGSATSRSWCSTMARPTGLANSRNPCRTTDCGSSRVRENRRRVGWASRAPASSSAMLPAATILVFVDADVVLSRLRARRDGSRAGRSRPGVSLPSAASGLVVGAARPATAAVDLADLPAASIGGNLPHPSLAAANGQLSPYVGRRTTVRGATRPFVVRSSRTSHCYVRSSDPADEERWSTARPWRPAGCTTDLARCRRLREVLWSAFGSPAGAGCVVGTLGVLYVLPPVAALRGSRVGLIAYAAGVSGRVVSARRTGGRVWPDAFLHPLSVIAFGGLTARSCWGHRNRTLSWKDRRL